MLSSYHLKASLGLLEDLDNRSQVWWEMTWTWTTSPQQMPAWCILPMPPDPRTGWRIYKYIRLTASWNKLKFFFQPVPGACITGSQNLPTAPQKWIVFSREQIDWCDTVRRRKWRRKSLSASGVSVPVPLDLMSWTHNGH